MLFYPAGYAVVPYFNGFAVYDQRTGRLASPVFYSKDENKADSEERAFAWLLEMPEAKWSLARRNMLVA